MQLSWSITTQAVSRKPSVAWPMCVRTTHPKSTSSRRYNTAWSMASSYPGDMFLQPTRCLGRSLPNDSTVQSIRGFTCMRGTLRKAMWMSYRFKANLFRHDRGAFWSRELFIKYLGLPNNRLVRCLVNPVTKARAIYKGMSSTDSADGAIIQDLLLPVDTSEAFVEYANEELNIWPLWICPIRKKAGGKEIVGWPFYKTENKSATTSGLDNGKAVVLEEKDEIAFNFGAWGPTDPTPAVFRTTNRRLEEKLGELRGMKVLYAANFYTEDEFWDLYDRRKSEQLRKKWHAEALPNMYDKVRRRQSPEAVEEKASEEPQPVTWKDRILQIWPLAGLYQMAHAVLT
jgi:delta24-sterol reductase